MSRFSLIDRGRLLGDADEQIGNVSQNIQLDYVETHAHSLRSEAVEDEGVDELDRPQEQKKTVSSRRTKSAWAIIAVYHLPPVIVTIALLAFYISELPWAPPGPSNNIRNMIQILAKIHEGLIIVSLTQILLHHFCFQLMGIGGLFFGHLNVPYQLGSPSILFSKAFWSTTTSTGRSQLCTTLLIICCSVLAMMCGPASAILMLPQVDWWPVSNTLLRQVEDGQSVVPLDIYINASYA